MKGSGLWKDQIPTLSAFSLSVVFFLLFILDNWVFFLPGIVTSVLALYAGSDKLVDQSGLISARIGLSGKMEGVLILSLAAVADEFFLTLIAAFTGHGGISFGAIQGSNDFTLAAVLIVAPALAVSLRLKDFRMDVFYLLMADAAVIVLSYFYNVIPVYYAALFFVLFAVYFILTAKKQDSAPQEQSQSSFSVLILMAAILIIFFASYFMTSYAVFAVDEIKINDFMSGFLISGVAGSIPEIVIIYITLRRKKNAVSTGVIIGSTIYKLTIILGVVSLVGNLNFQFSRWSSYLLLLMGFIMLVVRTDYKRVLAPILGSTVLAAGILLYLFL